MGIRIKNIILIMFGAAIASFGLVHFNMAHHLAEGGVTGVGLLLYFLFHIDPSISTLVMNVPLFFVGWRLLGLTSFIYTLLGTVSLSFFLWVFQRLHFTFSLHNDLTIIALLAGVSVGGGLGIVFRYGGTTGGVDIIARLLYKKHGISMGKSLFIGDFLVICLSLIYLNYYQAIYTLVAVFVAAQVINFIQENGYSARGATIISDRSDEIANQIMKELERGVTSLSGQGYYTKQKRDVLYCVFPKNELIHVKTIITSIDPHAFVAISEVYDVLGEGFTLDENKRPLPEQ